MASQPSTVRKSNEKKNKQIFLKMDLIQIIMKLILIMNNKTIKHKKERKRMKTGLVLVELIITQIKLARKQLLLIIKWQIITIIIFLMIQI